MDIVEAGAPGRLFVQQNASKTEKSTAILRKENATTLPPSRKH
jgi:hypothetical protein